MAFIPNKMDETQIAFLANEITKSYMTGKNIGSQEEFALEYYYMYRNTMELIARQEKLKTDLEAIQADFENMLDASVASSTVKPK